MTFIARGGLEGAGRHCVVTGAVSGKEFSCLSSISATALGSIFLPAVCWLHSRPLFQAGLMINHTSSWLGIAKAPSLPTPAPGKEKHGCFFSMSGTFPLSWAPTGTRFVGHRSPHPWPWFLVQVATSSNFYPISECTDKGCKAVKSWFIGICFSSGKNTVLCAWPGKSGFRMSERRNITHYFYCNLIAFSRFLSPIAALCSEINNWGKHHFNCCAICFRSPWELLQDRSTYLRSITIFLLTSVGMNSTFIFYYLCVK